MIVALEGIDASGKETQSRKLVERIQRTGIESERFDFPRYDSLTGKEIKALLQREWGCERRKAGQSVPDEERIAFVLQILMTVNRYEHYLTLTEWESERLGLPLTHEGVLVLDRYYASGLAYGQADGLDKSFLCRIHQLLPSADLWILVDITPEESVARRPEREDEYEQRAGFLHKVRERYIDLFENPPMAGRWAIVEGKGTEDEVHERIWRELTDLLPI